MAEELVVPRTRSRVSVMCALLFGNLALVGILLVDSELLRKTSPVVILGMILGTILHSFCLLIEEWLFHSRQRYGGSIQWMLQVCFSSAALLGLFVIILILLVEGVECTHENCVILVLTSAFFLLLKTIGVLGPAPVEISEVCESSQLNVAHGLAWSFYLGYLKLVLPELEEQMKKYYNQTGEILSSYRLHILLPLNAAVTSRLEENDNNVHFHQNLPELQLNRAGVRNRVYKHSIYKITDNNEKPYYCVVEYATPLMTLYQMSQDNSAGFGERDRKQQVLLFYKTLSHILENSLECRNHYRLILLNDEKTGDPHYLSKMITKHLQQQQREIPINLPPEVDPSVQEQRMFGTAAVVSKHQQVYSSDPSLMISRPMPLRSEPVENTDNTYNRHR